MDKKLKRFTDLLYTVHNKNYSFYYNSMFNQWYLSHADTSRAYRENIYTFFRKFLGSDAKFSMWESTHSRVEFSNMINKQLDKAIEKLEKQKDPYCTLRVGKTYKLNQDLKCGRILVKSGSIVEVNGTTPKSWGGSYLTIKPISGKFALSVHSSFFKTSKVSVNGNSNKLYTVLELKEIIGIVDFANEITFDDYGNAGRVLADER